ncbi:MAG: HAMP domain-containing protein [Candidatus Marinimicrobia bacterium]|nr:HAMP domain-containing protein [Candidatus Neomarinimicrobiota bacterium]
MKLRIKLISAFLTIAILLVGAGLWSIKGFKSLGVSVQTVLDENYRTISATHTMVEALEREDSAILLLMQGYWEIGRDQIEKADSSFMASYKVALANITVSGEQEVLNTLRQDYAAYKNIWERPIVSTNREDNLSWYHGTAHVAFIKVKQDLSRLAQLNDQSMYATSSSLEETAERAMMPGIIAICIAFILTALFSYFVSALIVTPILRMTQRVRAFREGGDLTKLDIHTGDEIQDLADEIRLLANRKSGNR